VDERFLRVSPVISSQGHSARADCFDPQEERERDLAESSDEESPKSKVQARPKAGKLGQMNPKLFLEEAVR